MDSKCISPFRINMACVMRPTWQHWWYQQHLTTLWLGIHLALTMWNIQGITYPSPLRASLVSQCRYWMCGGFLFSSFPYLLVYHYLLTMYIALNILCCLLAPCSCAGMQNSPHLLTVSACAWVSSLCHRKSAWSPEWSPHPHPTPRSKPTTHPCI